MKIEDKIKIVESNYKRSSNIQKLEKTNQNFEKLIKDGLVKKRGYNLFSNSDVLSEQKTSFNIND